MAVHYSHAGIPYAVRHARYTLPVQMVASTTNIPTDPGTPACAVSLDAAAYNPSAETPVVIGTAKGTVLHTFSGAEMDCALCMASFSAASGATIANRFVQPRDLPIISSGTAQAGGAASITLAANGPSVDLRGEIIRTTGGTGGGGTGGAGNQARLITAYNATSKVATVSPPWETAPDVTTTYDVLRTELSGGYLRPALMGETLDTVDLVAQLENNVLTANMLAKAR